MFLNIKMMQFPVLIYQDEDGVFIGEVPTLKGVHTYGKTLKELYKNLEEVVQLYLEVEKTPPLQTHYYFQILNINDQAENSTSQKNYQVA